MANETPSEVKVLTVITSNKIAGHELPAFRGAVCRAARELSDSVLFHNHSESGYRMSYPLVQYKRIGGCAAIVGLGDGANVVEQLLAHPEISLSVGTHEMMLDVAERKATVVPVGVHDAFYDYSLRGWVPLNKENYSAFVNTKSLVQRIELLQRILTGNILSMFKGLGVIVGERIECRISSLSRTRVVRYKGVMLSAFDLEFSCNAVLPRFAGLGNSVSVGFGVVAPKCASQKSNVVFLLGGRDLEMITIRNLLRDCGAKYYDRGLSWNNANLSAYSDCLSHQKGAKFVAVELRNDMDDTEGVTFVDHHNDRQAEMSSLEQVAQILDVKLNRWQTLVAANDSRYIVGLQEAGASPIEIADVRLADRKAQGVTQEDESAAMADVALRQIIGDLVIVKTRAKRFSPVVDRLWPYTQALVYNDATLTYYGAKCKKLVEAYNKEINQGVVYYGGGDNGFVGIAENVLSPSEIQRNVEFIKSIVTR